MTIATNNPVTTTVYYKATRAAAWTQDDDIYVDSLDFALAPKIDTCQLRRPYGLVVKTATTSRNGSKAVVAPLDLRGQWIKVRMQWDSGDTTIGVVGVLTQYWYGYCPQQVDEVRYTADSPLSAGTDLHQGVNQYTAFGLEYYLSTTPVTGVFLDDGAGGVNRTVRPLPFNLNRSSQETGTHGNRAASASSATTAAGYAVYAIEPQLPPYSTSSSKFTALNVLQQLIYAIEDDLGFTVTLSGVYASLDNWIAPFDFEGETYWSALNEVLSPSRGWVFDVVATDADAFTLYIQTTSDTALTGTTGADLLAANSDQITLRLDRTESAGTATIEEIETANYDAVEVQGAPVRCEWTMAYDYGTMDAAWSSADAATYASAGVSSPLHNVYRHFRIPADWNGSQTHSGTPYPCIPQGDVNARVSFSSPQDVAAAYLQLLPTATVMDDTQGGIGTTEFKQGPLVAYIYDEDLSKYVRSDIPEDDTKPPFTVRVGDDGQTIVANVPYDHLLGLNHVSLPVGTGGGSSVQDSRPAAYDWQTMYVTVQSYTDAYWRAYRALAGEPGEVERIKRIRMPMFDNLCRATGTVRRVVGGNLEAFTQDAAVYEDVVFAMWYAADLAKAWYGQRRSRVSLPYRSIWIPHVTGTAIRPGNMISATDIGTAVVPTSTVVSSISFSWKSGQSVGLKTEWQDLELPALFRPSRNSTGDAQRSSYTARPPASPATNIGVSGANEKLYLAGGSRELDAPSGGIVLGNPNQAYEPITGCPVMRRGDEWVYAQSQQTKLTCTSGSVGCTWIDGLGAIHSDATSVSASSSCRLYIAGVYGSYADANCKLVTASQLALGLPPFATPYDWNVFIADIDTDSDGNLESCTLGQHGMPVIVAPGLSQNIDVRNAAGDGVTTISVFAGQLYAVT